MTFNKTVKVFYALKKWWKMCVAMRSISQHAAAESAAFHMEKCCSADSMLQKYLQAVDTCKPAKSTIAGVFYEC